MGAWIRLHLRLMAAVAAVAVAALVVWLVVKDRVTSKPQDHPLKAGSCGMAVNSGIQYDPTPTNCLWRAYLSRSSGQAVVVNYTAEGDAVIYTIVILPTMRVNVSIQSQDRYGPQGSFGYACQTLLRRPYPALPQRFNLIATGCTGPVGFIDKGQVTIP